MAALHENVIVNEPVLAHCLGGRDVLLDKLGDYLRLPSVGTDPAYADGMERARSWLEHYLDDIGFQDIQRLDGGGQPAVFAQRLDATDRPTLLVYAHYDVQPPDPVDRWESPPFEPTVRNGRLHARGASDDKGPCLIALHALAGFIAVDGQLPVNIKILLEGEEETGSPSLANTLERYKTLLQADAVLSADGARWRADLPSVNTGSRGNGGIGLSVRTASKDLHSGRYGGAVPNALHVMTRMIASLHDEDGRIAVDGFYDGVETPGDDEREAMQHLPFDEPAWMSSFDSTAFGEQGWTTLERLWLRPTLEVNGLWGGYTGAGAKTVIPAEAHAKLTARLVPGQVPAQIEHLLRTHLATVCPPQATLTFEEQHGWVRAYSVPPDHPLLLAAESALTETTGQTPVRVRIGATLPLTDIVHSVLGIHTVMFSFSTADEDYHAPNEFIRLEAIDEGVAAWVAILDLLGKSSSSNWSVALSGKGGL